MPYMATVEKQYDQSFAYHVKCAGQYTATKLYTLRRTGTILSGSRRTGDWIAP